MADSEDQQSNLDTDTDIDKLGTYLPHLSAPILANLQKYYETLRHFNETINLVSKTTMPIAGNQHFADCVYGIQHIEKTHALDKPVYDFGSGNGFPGLVLSILKSDLPVFLVERDVRKAEFLKHIIGELQLKNASVLNQNIEALDKSSVELGITRALSAIANVTIQLTSIVKPGGRVFHFKGDSWTSELASCPTQVFTKWNIKNLGEYAIPENITSHVIVLSERKS